MATPAPSRPSLGANANTNAAAAAAATASLTPFSCSTSDARADRAFAAWFSALPPSPGGALRFFDRKDCYTLHGEDALLVARDLIRTPGAVTRMGDLPTLALNRASYEAVLRWALLEGGGGSGGRRVALFEPCSSSSSSTPGAPSSSLHSSWKKVKEASPGRLASFEGDLFRNADAPEAPPLMSVVIGKSGAVSSSVGGFVVGVAFVDAAARALSACQLGDDASFGVLESVAAAAGVREAVVRDDAGVASGGGNVDDDDDAAAPSASKKTPASSSSTAQAAALAAFTRASAALERAGALVTPLSRSAFATKELESDLSRLLRSRSLEQHRDVLDEGRPLASQALAGAISASEVASGGSSDPQGMGKWSLSLFDAKRSMRVDAAAAAALGVSQPRAGADPASSALMRLVNVGRTPMGRRLLPAWLRAPLVDAAEISRRHDVVSVLTEDAGLRLALRGSLLRGLPDVDRLARKLERGAAGLPDLCSLHRVVSRLGDIEAALRAASGVEAPSSVETAVSWFADPLKRAADAEHLAKFEDLVEAAVELDRVPDEYLIRAEYDDGLAELRSAKDAAEKEVERAASVAARSLGLALGTSVKLEWFKAFGGGSCPAAPPSEKDNRVRCLRVTATEERRIRSKLNSSSGEFQLLETRKDGTKFTSSALRKAAEALSRADAAVGKRQSALAAQVIGVAATFCDVWQRVGALLAELDALCAFADVGASAPSPWVRPTMVAMRSTSTSEGEATPTLLSLIDARHPVVESLDGVDFVPNSLVMSRGESWFTIVTGPNMGGKSTYIRSAGVCVLLAQAGCFVPCTSATVPIRDAVFARVGAGDCQSRGVSTFMAEMLETAAILRGATENSLVIVDELGRGTSTYDGLGLAAAIAEHLMEEVRCPTLFATHFHELTSLKSASSGVNNLHVETAADAARGGARGAARTGKGLTMLHRVAPGPCDESFGLACARAARLPDEVVEAAARKAAELEAAGVGKKRRVGGGDVARAKRFLVDFASLSDNEGEEQVRARARELIEGLKSEGGALAKLVA